MAKSKKSSKKGSKKTVRDIVRRIRESQKKAAGKKKSEPPKKKAVKKKKSKPKDEEIEEEPEEEEELEDLEEEEPRRKPKAEPEEEEEPEEEDEPESPEEPEEPEEEEEEEDEEEEPERIGPTAGEGGQPGPLPPSSPSGRTRVLDSYTFLSESIPVEVSIVQKDDFVPYYSVTIPGIAGGTKLLLETKLRAELISDVKLDITEILDPKKQDMVRAKFQESAMKVLSRNFPQLPNEKKKILASYLIQNTLGMGELETPLHDEFLEEVVVNNSRDPVWVYHKKYGWCKTNLRMKNESRIYDYAALVARKVGRQINILNPLLDAHLPSGDRVNATLFPVSNYGNTMTIRKFSKNPWTISNLIRTKTISPEVAATIWLCVQSELSLLVSGGTGSGKTSFLNALSGLIPASQRILSIEDTRELTLPSFLHWVPMVTREPNPEGKGEVSMLDLMINALRQRPDRIVVGEIRRQKEAEVLFEAMHTGHSVYATLHADNASQTISRLVNPPINVPEENLDALAGIVVQYRQRRLNIRRTLEFAEVQNKGDLNMIYRWDSKRDVTVKSGKLDQIADTIELYAGLNSKEIQNDVAEKTNVLNWMVKHGYEAVNEVGSIVSNYYRNSEEVMEAVKRNETWEF